MLAAVLVGGELVNLNLFGATNCHQLGTHETLSPAEKSAVLEHGSHFLFQNFFFLVPSPLAD